MFACFHIHLNKVRAICVSQIKQKQNVTTKGRGRVLYIFITQDKPTSKLLDHKFLLMHFASAKVGQNSLQTATENYIYIIKYIIKTTIYIMIIKSFKAQYLI